MKKKIIIIIGFILIVGIILFVLWNHSNQTDVVAIVNEQTYSMSQFKKEYKLKILKIDSNKVTVSNGETTYDCFYNKSCEIWPDSQNGTVMWEAPLVQVTFKKQ